MSPVLSDKLPWGCLQAAPVHLDCKGQSRHLQTGAWFDGVQSPAYLAHNLFCSCREPNPLLELCLLEGFRPDTISFPASGSAAQAGIRQNARFAGRGEDRATTVF